MPSKTITISTAKWNRVKKAFYDFVPQDTDGNPLYTEAEWVFVYMKRLFARKVHSYELGQQGRLSAPAYDENIIEIDI